MSDLIQNGLAGVNLYSALARVLLTVAIIMGLWALASVLLGLLIGGAFQVFGHRYDCCEKALETLRVKSRVPLASSLQCRTQTRGRAA
jgi:Na+/H+-dicarboxylate symporter